MIMKGGVFTMKNKPSTLNLREISYLLGVSEATALRYIKKSRLPVIINRGTIRIPSKDFFESLDYELDGGAA